MGYLHFEFLEKEKIVGNNCYEPFKKYGIKAAITDFAILLGGTYSNYCFLDDIKNLKNRVGTYYTSSYDTMGVYTVKDADNIAYSLECLDYYGARPYTKWDVFAPPIRRNDN